MCVLILILHFFPPEAQITAELYDIYRYGMYVLILSSVIFPEAHIAAKE